MATIQQLAITARVQNPDVLRNSPAPERAWESWLTEAWREFVERAGGVYTQTQEAALTIEQQLFDMPQDFRELLTTKQSVWLSYTPRTITSISRAADVAAVQTSTNHALETGMHVQIADVTPSGSDAFDDTDVAVTVTSGATFTYPNTGAADAGATGGTVECISTRQVLEPISMFGDTLDRVPSYEVTAGTPQYYFMEQNGVVGVSPVSDGATYPGLFVEYDALVPSDFAVTDTLPVSDAVADYLIGYAMARAQGQPKAAVLGAGVLEPMVLAWKRLLSRRSR